MVKPKSLGEQRIELDKLNADAKHLKSEFDRGDMLAPFECCWRWRRAGIDNAELPTWVLEHLASIAADYFSKSPFPIFDADEPDDEPDDPQFVSPRAFLEMKSKERKKREPSLDKAARLSGTQGKGSAWWWRAEHGRDPSMESYLNWLERQAAAGDDTWVLHLEDRASKKVTILEIPILDKHGRLRDEVRDQVARLFRVGGYDGEDWNKARTTRRRAKSVKGSDK